MSFGVLAINYISLQIGFKRNITRSDPKNKHNKTRPNTKSKHNRTRSIIFYFLFFKKGAQWQREELEVEDEEEQKRKKKKNTLSLCVLLCLRHVYYRKELLVEGGFISIKRERVQCPLVFGLHLVK